MFIVNDEDMRALKQVIKARWLARRMKRYPGVDVEEFRAQVDRDVEKRFIENYAWFAHRVRRHIPEPKELEEVPLSPQPSTLNPKP